MPIICVHDLILPVEFFHAALGQIGAKSPRWPGVIGIGETTAEAATALRFAIIGRIDSAVARQRGEDLAAASW